KGRAHRIKVLVAVVHHHEYDRQQHKQDQSCRNGRTLCENKLDRTPRDAVVLPGQVFRPFQGSILAYLRVILFDGKDVAATLVK
ncbi:MAG: hypothetical protein KAJ06_00250, partial [Gammaproteobacteria bacterium]|nr:hypothetical protein [Gammaproteobacteria bacterium]